MDVSPSLRLDDHFKASDLFDLVSCSEYDLSGTGIGHDWGALDDFVGRPVNNNNVGDISQSWSSGPYQDPPPPTPPPTGVHHSQDKEKDTSDKMWGGGGTTEKVVSATGNTIIITFPPTDSAAHSGPDTSEAVPHNPSPPMTEHSNLDLFNSILNEKPYDVLASHNHRSPASDCVSYASACSGYSDSGISTSLEDTASPNGGGHDHVDFDRLMESAVDPLVYSPGAGGLAPVDDGTGLDGSTGFLSNSQMSSYMTPVTQSNDVSSILEGALRGTVRRPGGPAQPPAQLNKVSESKTLTLMSNMTPLPPLTTAFKAEQLNGVAGSTQISSSNGMYVTTGYDYNPPPPEELSSLDISFTKLSTTTTTKVQGMSDNHKPKKRKYTKRQPGDEPTSKGRLLHFCHICNKGFKDKYSVNVHIRTHTGEKPFNCELCGKCFRQKAHLAKHVQIHTTPKPPGKRNLLNTMDVSPSLRLDDHFKSSDLFDLVSCSEYDLSGTGLGHDWGPLDDIVGRPVNNNNVGDISQSWSSGPYQDPPTSTLSPTGVHDSQKKEDIGDKMWGSGGTTENVINSATGSTIIITFPPTDSAAYSGTDTSEATPHNPSPPMIDPSNLDLFNSILKEKPYDVLLSHNHRSPVSDCVSYASACSGYSDSGISTSLEDTSSPNGGNHGHVDFDRLMESAVDPLMYSPGSGGLGTVDDGTGIDGNGFLSNPQMSSYLTPATLNNDVSSILEGALRGTVRRPGGPTQPPAQLNKVSESKTLTLMSNMTPLPPITTAFKAEQLNGVAGSNQISSSNGMYVTTAYDYNPPPPEELSSLDVSFTNLSTTTTTKVQGMSDNPKPKKRKYTRSKPGDEPTSKGRLLHFCHICNKGFKDKYSVNVHIRTHTGEKPFNCELCGKCFRQKAHLTKHVQSHTTPKPPGKR